MSDHDPAPDPMDKAYTQAEAMLDDEAARAARRARVLGAVAREAQAPAAVSTTSRRRLAWGRGGWLAAASVAGLSALVAIRLYQPPVTPPAPPPADASAAAAQAPAFDAAQESAAAAHAPAPPQAQTAQAVDSRAEMRSRRDVPVVVAPPPPPPPVQAAPEPAPPSLAMPPASEDVARRAASPLAAARAPSAAMEAADTAPPVDRAARLRAAAAAGRTAELTGLLTRGAPIDAPDDDGDTALMKAVQANHPAAAALLRRHGADLDLENRAGVSARDMAASIGDPELDRALGLAP